MKEKTTNSKIYIIYDLEKAAIPLAGAVVRFYSKKKRKVSNITFMFYKYFFFYRYKLTKNNVIKHIYYDDYWTLIARKTTMPKKTEDCVLSTWG